MEEENGKKKMGKEEKKIRGGWCVAVGNGSLQEPEQVE